MSTRHLRVLGALVLGCLAPTATLAVAPSGIPFNIEPSPLETHGTRVIYALAGLVLAGGGVLWFFKRRRPDGQGFAPAEKPVHVVARSRLTTRCTLFVVRYRGQELLVAVSGDQVVRLHTVTPAENEARDA